MALATNSKKPHCMAINLSTTASLHSKPSFLTHKHNNLIKIYHPSSSLLTTCAQTQGTDTGVTQEDASAGNGIYANNSYPLFIIIIIIESNMGSWG